MSLKGEGAQQDSMLLGPAILDDRRAELARHDNDPAAMVKDKSW